MTRSRAPHWKLFGTLIALGLHVGAAGAADVPFAEWLDGVRQEARSQGISDATLDAAFAGAEPIGKVLELDRKQPEFTLTFQQYMDRVVTPDRVERGKRLFAEHHTLLEAIGRQYGVSPRFVVALWGIETDFGRLSGGFPVVHALATLAYDGRRSAYFRNELMQALSILQAGHVTAEKMRGSWAGAMGQCQFMPSSFLRFGRDQNGDGHIDIWGTLADVFGSAANYLATSGWKSSQTWGRAVTVPTGLNPDLINDKTPRALGEWASIGVKRADGGPLPGNPDVRATLITAEAGGPTFLVYDNFRTILKWNRSVFFGLAVGHLADAIGTP